MRYLACFLAGLILMTAGPLRADAGKNRDKPVVLVLNDWSSQKVATQIYAGLLRREGLKVRFRELSAALQYGALARGTAHVQVEVWATSSGDEFENAHSQGKVSLAGYHDAFGREGWWYPTYVKERCPGLPDWRALRDCSTLFSRSGSTGRGIYYAGIWDVTEAKRIEALGLRFQAVRVRYDDTHWQRLKSAYEAKRPIILYNWSPHWVEKVYEGEFVRFPRFEPDCLTDPAWGPNPAKTHDCSLRDKKKLMKVIWPQFDKYWPCAYSIVRKLSFTDDMIAEMSYQVDIQGKTVEETARNWLNGHKGLWSKWACS